MNRNDKLAGLGAVLVLPALLLVSGGLLQSGLGSTVINDALNFKLFFFHPVVILGGLVLAFALNLWPLIRISHQDRSLSGTIVIKDRLLNVALVSAIGMMAAVIFLYLLAENLQLFKGIF